MDEGYIEGYIKLFRKLTVWEWYTDSVVKLVFIHCLLKANYKDKKWRGITIKRGQFVTSYPSIAKECGITVNQARRAISTLCNTGEITHKPQARFSVVTVVKYDLYQADHRLNDSLEDSLTTGSPQQHKNIKNNKKYKKKNTPELKNPWIGIASDGEEYYINEKKYHEWNKAHGITEDD